MRALRPFSRTLCRRRDAAFAAVWLVAAFYILYESACTGAINGVKILNDPNTPIAVNPENDSHGPILVRVTYKKPDTAPSLVRPELHVVIWEGTSGQGQLWNGWYQLDTLAMLNGQEISAWFDADTVDGTNTVRATMCDNMCPITGMEAEEDLLFDRPDTGDSFVLLAWCGDYGYGSPGDSWGDELYPWWSHELCVRVIDPSTADPYAGVPGRTIKFVYESRGLRFLGFYGAQGNVTHPYSVFPVNDSAPEYDGMVATIWGLRDTTGEFLVVAYDSAHPSYTDTFHIWSVDEESDALLPVAGLDTLDLHWLDVLGDGLWANGDYDTTVKEVVVEVDYDTFGPINKDFLESDVAPHYQDILAGAGIGGILEVATRPAEVPDVYTWEKMKETLARERDFGRTGLGIGRLHAVIGGKAPPLDTFTYYGNTVAFNDSVFGVQGYRDQTIAAHHEQPTSGVIHPKNDRLDSVGVLVFANAIQPSQDSWGYARQCAFFLAHETGHAMGLAHIQSSGQYPTPNVMSAETDMEGSPYDDYAKWVRNDAISHRICLRHLLGRESLLCGWASPVRSR